MTKQQNIFSRLLSILLCVSILAPSFPGLAMAAEPESFVLPEEGEKMLKGNEFTSGAYPGAALMPINLWGAVGKSGIHHVPARTNLLTLLSFGGGPNGDADLSDVTLRRQSENGTEIQELNLKKLMKGPPEGIPVLRPNDVVYIPRKEELISNNTLKTVTFVSALAGIVLTVVLSTFYIKNMQPAASPAH